MRLLPVQLHLTGVCRDGKSQQKVLESQLIRYALGIFRTVCQYREIRLVAGMLAQALKRRSDDAKEQQKMAHQPGPCGLKS
ncbi:MAG: hypothetical protein ACOYX1_17630 [Acidobacteriota bacterium]